MFDNQDLAITVENSTALAAYNQAMSDLLEYRLTAMPSVKHALEIEPSFCMAHCLRGYMLMMYSSFNVYDNASVALENAKRCAQNASLREQRHVRALEFWRLGDLHSACAQWQQILIDHPHDILALRLHHFVSFWMGRTEVLQSAPAAVLPAWTPEMPNYGNVLGMLAFGLQENGHFTMAEEYGRDAVARCPDDLWAVHAVAHVFEMQGRHAEGREWFAVPLDKWDDRNPFRGHLWWHLGLFTLEAGDIESALALYDKAIYTGDSDFYLDIQNAASFLARVEFKGAKVGARWKLLADYAEAHRDDHALVFTDLHSVMSLARERRFGAARAHIQSMKDYASDSNMHVAQVIRRVGLDACEGILAFEEGEFDKCLSLIHKLRPLLQEVGASHAQRDIVVQYANEAARRSDAQRTLAWLANQQDFDSRLAQS